MAVVETAREPLHARAFRSRVAASFCVPSRGALATQPQLNSRLE
jgi:hypothetical protein